MKTLAIIFLFIPMSVVAGIKTPYGEYEQLLGVLKSGTPMEGVKHRALGKMDAAIPWLVKNGYGGRADAAYSHILVMARKEKVPLTRKKSIRSVKWVIDRVCKRKGYADKAMTLAVESVSLDASHEVRMEAVSLIARVARCRNKQADEGAMKALLKVISRDSHPDVIDHAARWLVLLQEKGFRVPVDARAVIIRAARRFLVLQKSDAAWMVFSRSPFKFHELPEIHDELVEGPVPTEPVAVLYALNCLDDSLAYLENRESPGELVLKMHYLKYRLYTSGLSKSIEKLLQATVDYQRIVRKRTVEFEKLPVEERMKRLKAIWDRHGINEEIRIGADLQARASVIGYIKKKLKRDGGTQGVLVSIADHAGPGAKKNTRTMAWEMMSVIRRKTSGRLPENVIARLERYYSQEKDKNVRKAAAAFFVKKDNR